MYKYYHLVKNNCTSLHQKAQISAVSLNPGMSVL